MDRKVGFLNVDTLEPRARTGRFVTRARASGIASPVRCLLDFARQHEHCVVWTTCVNVTNVQECLGCETLCIGMADDESAWGPALDQFRDIYVEKTGLGCREYNIRDRCYDLFSRNKNTVPLLRQLDLPSWVVFGVSPEYCLRTTVEGILALGYGVSIPVDAVGDETVPGETVSRELARLKRRGARLTKTTELLEELREDA